MICELARFRGVRDAKIDNEHSSIWIIYIGTYCIRVYVQNFSRLENNVYMYIYVDIIFIIFQTTNMN